MSYVPARSRPAAGRARAAFAALLAMFLVPLVALPAEAAGTAVSRIDLRVLVVTNGAPNVEAIATQLDRQGVPYTEVNLWAWGRPIIDAAFLEDAAAGIGRFQAVVLPNQAGAGLPADELAALATYEAAYGVRQVNGYDFPVASMGFGPNQYAGSLDGQTATVTSAARTDAMSYLSGSLAIDDFDPAATEVYGFLAPPSSSLPADESFTSLLTASAGDSTGTVVGAYAHDGREELTITAAFNSYMQWFNEIGPGIVNWMTRGIHLGHQRQYLAVHVDDVFLPDSRWSVTGKCTPGDDCVDPTVTTPDIRMTSGDVTRLVDWQDSNDFAFDLVFNGGGSEAWKLENGGVDPLADALLAQKSEFPWINHTYTHPFLGCIQIAPTVAGEKWHCATSPTEAPRQDPEIPQALSDGIYWASQGYINGQIQNNISWATTNALPNFDAAELVTGEHSGLRTFPQQPIDNPFLAPALATTGVQWIASDASREPDYRVVGSATTVPRHPMNIYYNTATYQEQISEYNWYYTSRANGGSGICEDNPETTTCITPLPAATAAQAKASFDSYLQPLEERNALSFALTNDPRPFYVHQSNLAEDGILYPVVEGVLDHYASVYDTAKAPLVHLDMTDQGAALKRMAAWHSASSSVTAYIDAAGVHLPSSGSTAVPLTVPTGTTVSGASLESYGGALSGWTSGNAVTAVPPTPWGGYGGTPAPTAPVAPAIGTATAGDASATVTWTAPASDGGSAVTGYTVRAYVGSGSTVVATAAAPAGATSATVPGLTNGTSYTFDVVATNAVGTSSASARSNPVTPTAAMTAPTAPAIGTATAGEASATVTWAPPASDGGSAITGYTVRAYIGAGSTVATSVTVDGAATSATVPGLSNGTSYTFDVIATNAVGTSPASQRSNAVTPTAALTVPSAPTNSVATAGNASATVTWTAPASDGGSAITGYTVRAYVGAGPTVVASATVGGGATSATVPGLTNGTSYTFDVVATNAVGASTASERSNAVTPTAPATVPAAPAIGTATAGDKSATVTWSAPVSDGGSAITGYTVRAYQSGSPTVVTSVTAAPGARSATVAGLTNGVLYSFDVVATNAIGDSPASAKSNEVKPTGVPTVPAVPTNVVATAGDKSATVTWAPPASDGGSAITGYSVRAYLGSSNTAVKTVKVVGPATSATVTGLTNGTAYTFAVFATNTVGNSAFSVRSNSVTPVAGALTVPAAPAIGTATAGDKSATVTWSAPVSDGGSAITGYTVRAYVGDGAAVFTSVTAAAGARSATVPGLTNGTTYKFDVVATNAVGTSPASSKSNAVTPTGVMTIPATPTDVVATAGDKSATVSWTPPATDGGSAITGYAVRAYLGSTTTAVKTVKVAGSVTTTTITGLTNGTAYTFAVYATNAVGNSAFSVRSNSVTPTASASVPAAPTNVVATAGDKAATVTWSAPASDGGSAITGYTVTAYLGSTSTVAKTMTVAGAATSATVTGLTNGTAYTFAVGATNAVGTGVLSARSNSVTPGTVGATVPGAPTNVTATKGVRSATVTWTPPASDGGSPITGYRVRAYLGSSTTVVKTMSVAAGATSATVTGLTNGTAYTFAVLATNVKGDSPFSARSNSVTPG